MDKFIPCFEKLTYRDVMFQKWIRMDTAQRKSVIQKHFPEYAQEMQKICRDAKNFN